MSLIGYLILEDKHVVQAEFMQGVLTCYSTEETSTSHSVHRTINLVGHDIQLDVGRIKYAKNEEVATCLYTFDLIYSTRSMENPVEDRRSLAASSLSSVVRFAAPTEEARSMWMNMLEKWNSLSWDDRFEIGNSSDDYERLKRYKNSSEFNFRIELDSRRRRFDQRRRYRYGTSTDVDVSKQWFAQSVVSRARPFSARGQLAGFSTCVSQNGRQERASAPCRW